LALLVITGIELADGDGVATNGGGPDGGIGLFNFPVSADADEPLKSESEINTEIVLDLWYVIF